MKITKPVPAFDFEAQTIDGKIFNLSDYKGSRILLSFFRNGACAICNLRIHELMALHDELNARGIKVVAVFESSIADMLPYVGQQHPPFVLLSDPQGKLYEQYGLESSEEKVNAVIKSNVAHDRIALAAQNGFQLTQQERSNFFRLPADFLIDENFVIRSWHYSDQVIDHMEVEVLMCASSDH